MFSLLSSHSIRRFCCIRDIRLSLSSSLSVTSNAPSNNRSSLKTPTSTKPVKKVRFLTTPPTTPTPVYVGPLSTTVRLLKWFSITTAALTVTFSPVLIFLGNPSTPLLARVTLSSIVLTVGVSTTLLLHWFIKGYVCRLYYHRGSGQLKAVTLDMIGREKETHFHISEAIPPDKVAALSTFAANGKNYFLHADIFGDPELLQRLAGPQIFYEETSTTNTRQ